MYAIIETGSRQYKVSPGEIIRLESVNATPGSETILRHVIALFDKELHIGTPYLEKAGVVCEVINAEQDRKIRMYKYKRRKGSKRRRSHRQSYMLLKVKEIALTVSDAEVADVEKETSSEVKTKKKPKAKGTKTTTSKQKRTS